MDINHVYNSKTNKVICVVMPEKMILDLKLLTNDFPRDINNSSKTRKNRSEFIRGSIYLTSTLQEVLPFEEYNDIENYTKDLLELIKLGQEAKEARPKV